MKQTVIDVLNNYHTQSVKFTYTSVTGMKFRIHPNDFLTVALNIEQGNIDVQKGGVKAGKARYFLRDEGNKKANTFYIGQNNSSQKIFESLFVHESVHAIYDLKGIIMPWLDNETIAYIAQGFYLLSSGAFGKLDNLAYLGLEAASQLQTAEESAKVNELRQALLNDPLYKDYINGNFEGDG
jgi:hypothetical protein